MSTRLGILKEYCLKKGLLKVARGYVVSRLIIYKWDKVVKERMRQASEKLKPEKRNITVEQQNKKLKEEIKRLINLLQKDKKKFYLELDSRFRINRNNR
ncbi:MAG: hypothetical protein NC827_06405 [Candidatus Omnitrophica bacterium]|nr:hypothetical protein [Candidatus Omnitrophota bacterium]MCM8802921.1 hypothetical protein [Candidatus Omnitrophota bacterium]